MRILCLAVLVAAGAGFYWSQAGMAADKLVITCESFSNAAWLMRCESEEAVCFASKGTGGQLECKFK